MHATDKDPLDLITELGDVAITDELAKRGSRAPDYELEHRATSALIEALAASPSTLLQYLCDLLVEFGLAQTAGVSLHEPEHQRLRWVAVAGEWAPHLGGVMPFGASPCSAVIIRNEPMLFARPLEHFPAANVEPFIREILLVPFRSGGKPVGTLWVMAHDEAKRFDAEDLRLLTSLSHVAAAAYGTTRALAEADAGRRDLEASRNLLQGTMDASTDMIQVFEAIRDDRGEIVDFRWVLNNHTSESLYGKVESESLLERNPGVVVEGIFDDFKRVTETGEPIQKERHYAHGQFDGWFYQSVVKLGDGVATTTKEITAWKKAQAEVLRLQAEVAQAQLRESEEKFRALFNSIDEGLAIVEMIYDAQGAIIDMVFRQVNAAYERQGGIHDVVGRALSEMVPGLEEVWLERYRRVAMTGETLRVQDYQRDVDRWFDVYFSRIDRDGHFVAVVFNDISERKRTDAESRANAERQSFLLRFSDALRAEVGADAIADRAIRMVAEQLQLDRCYITYYRPAEDAADFPYQFGNDSVPALPDQVRLSDFPDAYDQVRDRTFVVTDDFERRGLSETERANSKALGIRAMVASTARQGEKNPLSSLVAISSRPRLWTEVEVALIEEAAERTWAAMDRARAEAALRESEEALANDLADTEQLRKLAERLITEERFETIYDEILGGTLVIAKAQAGTIQVFDPETRSLEIIASKNLSATITDYFHRVDASSRTACGVALRTGEREVVDFPEDDDDPGCGLLVSEGIQTAIALPLVSRSGAPLGMLNAHWREALHRPSDRELRFLDLLARQTADLIEQRRSAEALRQSEARLSAAFESVPVGAAVIDTSGKVVISNAEYRRFLPSGLMPSRNPEIAAHWQGWDAAGRSLAIDDFPGARALRGESVVPGQEMLFMNEDGREIWTSVATAPTRDERGRVTGAVSIISDIDVAKRSTEALRRSEERLREFGEASQDILWIRDAAALQWQYLTPAFEEIYGFSREEALTGNNYRSWLDLIVPEDRQVASDSIARVRAGERVQFEYRIRRPSDGTIRWLRNTDFPITDSAGEITHIGGIGHDITDRREAEGRQEILLAELQHRVRNILAVIRSMIRRSNDGERSTDDYVQHLEGRLSALARTQVLLTRSAGANVNFEDMIRDELLAQAAKEAQFSIAGPDVALSPKAAEVLTLAVHELATNATKYGAFSRESGRLEVRWAVELRGAQNWLSLHWRETGVPVVEAVPRRLGFGTELISRRIPYELKGSGSFELRPGGLESRIEFPLRSGDSILQTDGVSL